MGVAGAAQDAFRRKPAFSVTRRLPTLPTAARTSTRVKPCPSTQSVNADNASVIMPRPRAHGAVRYPTSTLRATQSGRLRSMLPAYRPWYSMAQAAPWPSVRTRTEWAANASAAAAV